MDLEYIAKHFDTITKMLDVAKLPHKDRETPEKLKEFLGNHKKSYAYLDGLITAIENKNEAYLLHFKGLVDR
ncbi:hypothetical protein BVY03_05025 [bacterium K02(2017)]|nr:hypothetical protein BVY03_05025 [bacterium K02(2017)]